MTATNTIYHGFHRDLFLGVHDLNATDAVLLTLHTSTYTPNQDTHDLFSELTNELATANGYTNGGMALANEAVSLASGTTTFDADDLTINVVTANLVWRYAVLHNTTPTTPLDPLMCYILGDDTPADVTTTPGNDLVFQWNASGIITATTA